MSSSRKERRQGHRGDSHSTTYCCPPSLLTSMTKTRRPIEEPLSDALEAPGHILANTTWQQRRDALKSVLDNLIWSGKTMPPFSLTEIKKKMGLCASFGPIHWQTTSREAWITQTVFAQLPGSHAHSNIGIYYSVLLKECWHKHSEAKTWGLCNTLF